MVIDIKIKTVSNFLHLIILHIGAHITLEQIKGVVGTTIRSLCFLLVWLFVTEVYFLYPECNTVIILSRDTCKFWRGPGSCYWMTRMFWWIVHLLSMIDFFFGRAEIFVGIWTINGKIVWVLNKNMTPQTGLSFVDADKKKLRNA